MPVHNVILILVSLGIRYSLKLRKDVSSFQTLLSLILFKIHIIYVAKKCPGKWKKYTQASVHVPGCLFQMHAVHC